MDESAKVFSEDFEKLWPWEEKSGGVDPLWSDGDDWKVFQVIIPFFNKFEFHQGDYQIWISVNQSIDAPS